MAIVLSMRARGAEQGGSVPLYMLPMTEETQEELRQSLQAELSTSTKLDSVGCAAFVLYCSYEFCRSHKGGSWAWETALGPLGVRLTPTERICLADRGLAFWRRDLIETAGGREFLTTLVCEGGLPLSLLKQDNACLTGYFRALLREAETFPHLSVSDLASRESVSSELTKSLRAPVVYTLAATLISLVRSARQRISSTSEDPLEEARKLGNWASQLPFKLEDDVAKLLLNGLLRERAPQSYTDSLVLETRLVRCSGRLVRKALLPARVERAELARSLGLEVDDLPVRFRLYLRSDGARLPLAIATQFGNEYALERVGQDLPFSVDERLQLVARLGETVLSQVSIPGGDPLDPDVPWAFVVDDGARELPLLGTGEMQTRRDSLFVLMPEGAKVTGEPGATIVEQEPHQNRACYIGTGTQRIVCGDDRWTVVCGATSDNTSRFMLRGVPRQLGVGGSSVFVGVPIVWSLDDGCPVMRSELEWRCACNRQEPWRQLDRSEPVGDIVLRQTTRLGGRFRMRIQVLPHGCLWSFGGDSNVCSVRFQNLGNCQAGVPSHLLESSFDQTQAELLIRLSAKAEPPRVFPLVLKFSHSQLSVEVAFPAERAMFVDWKGIEVDAKFAVSIAELSTLRAVMQTPHQHKDFVVHARSSTGGERPIGHLKEGDSGCLELPLDMVADEVSAMLAATDELDASVRLDVRDQGQARGHVIEVRRFDRKITRDSLPDRAVLHLDRALPHGECTLKMARFEDGLNDFVPLALTDDNAWEIDFSKWESGAWLVLAEAPQGMSIRPIRVKVPVADQFIPGNSLTEPFVGQEEARQAGLQGILSLPETSMLSRDHRLAAMDGILQGLEGDLANDAWAGIVAQLAMLPSVPASSMDIVRVLVRRPKALLLALLHRPKLATKLWLELETLPFLWKLLPLGEWGCAAATFTNYMAERTSENDAREIAVYRLESILDVGQRFEPVLQIVRMFLRTMNFEVPTTDSPVPTERRVRDSRQRMLRRPLDRSKAYWPAWHWQQMARSVGLPQGQWDQDSIAARQSVLNAPRIAARSFFSSTHLGQDEIAQLRAARDFDADWFEVAYLYSLQRLIQS